MTGISFTPLKGTTCALAKDEYLLARYESCLICQLATSLACDLFVDLMKL